MSRKPITPFQTDFGEIGREDVPARQRIESFSEFCEFNVLDSDSENSKLLYVRFCSSLAVVECLS